VGDGSFPSVAAWPVVHVVGIGDDGDQGLTARTSAIVKRADLLCGGERQLAFFPRHPAERFVIKSDVDALVSLLDGAVGRRRAAVLASGDPCFFGIGGVLAERLGSARVRIHPAPSSIALAFARLGIGWQDATVLSAHGRPLAGIVPRALAATTFAVLTDPTNTPAAVATVLLAAGMDDAQAWVCEHLGGERERLVESRLSDLRGREFAALNVLVVRRTAADVRLNELNGFGRAESDYASEHGQITKAEVRAIALAKLEPWRASVAWDIGAGSGATAIELAGLMPAGEVYAVERDEHQLAVIRANLARFPRPNLRVVQGTAPEALAGLPAPDAVFVGGAGVALAGVLGAALAALRPGGRMVANFAQLESLATWQAFAQERGLEQEVVQVSIARAAPLAGGTRLAPLNPVFVTRLQQREVNA
jgi:precorrin-6Y C5,15-methyltransferase (decarboxylating)